MMAEHWVKIGRGGGYPGSAPAIIIVTLYYSYSNRTVTLIEHSPKMLQ